MNRRRQAKEQLRQQILDVALELFSANGFDAVTVEQIADRSGVSPMTVFRHFGTKADIVFSDREAHMLALLEVARSCPPHADPRVRVVQALNRFTAETQHTLRLWMLRCSDIVAGSPTLQGLAVAGRHRFDRALVRGLTESAPPDQAMATEITALAGMSVFHHAVQWLPPLDDDLDEAVAQALALLWPDIANDRRRRRRRR